MYEEIYTSSYQPDLMRALDVLAFLLVPESAFLHRDASLEERMTVSRILHQGKREALLQWFASRVVA